MNNKFIELSDMVYTISSKLTDDEYKQIMEKIAEIKIDADNTDDDDDSDNLSNHSGSTIETLDENLYHFITSPIPTNAPKFFSSIYLNLDTGKYGVLIRELKDIHHVKIIKDDNIYYYDI